LWGCAGRRASPPVKVTRITLSGAGRLTLRPSTIRFTALSGVAACGGGSVPIASDTKQPGTKPFALCIPTDGWTDLVL
jgi:hypothetical protein